MREPQKRELLCCPWKQVYDHYTESREQGDDIPGEQWVFKIRAFLNKGMWKRPGLYSLERK